MLKLFPDQIEDFFNLIIQLLLRIKIIHILLWKLYAILRCSMNVLTILRLLTKYNDQKKNIFLLNTLYFKNINH